MKAGGVSQLTSSATDLRAQPRTTMTHTLRVLRRFPSVCVRQLWQYLSQSRGIVNEARSDARHWRAGGAEVRCRLYAVTIYHSRKRGVESVDHIKRINDDAMGSPVIESSKPCKSLRGKCRSLASNLRARTPMMQRMRCVVA